MEEKVTKKKPPVWLFIIIGVVVLTIIAMIVILVFVGGSDGKKDNKIKAEEKYLSELDYESDIESVGDADSNGTGNDEGGFCGSGSGDNSTGNGDNTGNDEDTTTASLRATDDLTNAYVGGYVTFGVYEQDGDASNGPEPIEWEVLDINENGMLLVSKYVLDCVQYYTEYIDMTWESCTLRSWLNNDFYVAAFDSGEQARINTTYVVNSANSYWGTSGGNDTNDKVFCLSVDEINKYYQFNWYDYDYMYGYYQRLITEATPYAISRGVRSVKLEDNYFWIGEYGYNTDDFDKAIGAEWWLRTSGSGYYFSEYYISGACNVDVCGAAGAYCLERVDTDYCGVRPVIYVQQ